MVSDYLHIVLNVPQADGEISALIWNFPETGQRYPARLGHSCLNYTAGARTEDADSLQTPDQNIA